MSVPTGYLHPTRTRLALLADVAAGEVFRDAANADYISGGQRVSGAITDLEAAGWITLVGLAHGSRQWQTTAYGRAIDAVRWHDFGPDAHIQMSAEVGDPDDPRILGIVQHLPPQPNRGPRWAVTLDDEVELCRTRLDAAAELRHRACLLLAAEEETALAAPIDRTATRVAEAAADTPAGLVHDCETSDMVEHEMSGCLYGCKVYRCRHCAAREVIHLAVYGCPEGRPALAEVPAELAPRQCGDLR